MKPYSLTNIKSRYLIINAGMKRIGGAKPHRFFL